MSERIGVNFVCLGNICRSPLGEGLFLFKAAERGLADLFEVDSCGLGHWHIGSPADPRSIAVAKKRDIHLPSRGRMVEPIDFDRFDYLIAMDQSIVDGLLELRADAENIHLMLDFFPEDTHMKDVPDPYTGSDDGFELVYNLIDRSCDGLLDHIVAEHSLQPSS